MNLSNAGRNEINSMQPPKALKSRILFCLSIIIFFVSPAFRDGLMVRGEAIVIDGDTLTINGRNIRLNGIAAPELNEKGGQSAKYSMERILKGKMIKCSLSGQKSYRRHIGTCWLGQLDIAAVLIAQGKARDCPRYSLNRYKALETSDSRRLILPRYCQKK